MTVPPNRASDPSRRADTLRDTLGPHHAGQIQDGHSYTGMSLIFKHPKSGHEVVGWSGEVHGTWGGNNNPALGMLQGARSYQIDGEHYRPTHAVFHSPHDADPRLQQTRYLHLPTAQLHRRER